jgi:hypothetical protein
VNELLRRARAIAGLDPHRGVPAPQHASRMPFAMLVVGLIVGGMALLLALNTASAANELRRNDLAGQDAGVGAQVQQLQIDVAASAAPGNLAQAAAALGMVPAGNPAFLVIGRDGSVRVLGSPAPVSAQPVVQQPAPKKQRKNKPVTTAAATASATSTKTTGPSSTHSSTSTSPAKPTPTPAKPTPTPTPTLTLPGGNR